jgi:hypothetical protein
MWLDRLKRFAALVAAERDKFWQEPQAERAAWVGLEEKEIKNAPHHMVDGAYHYSFKQGAQWAEAKLKEKNFGNICQT